MSHKILCSNCSGFVPFETLQLENGKGGTDATVILDANGGYVCRLCVENSPEGGDWRAVPYAYYTAMQQIKQMSGMTMMACDLLQQALRHVGDDAADYTIAIEEWIAEYKKFRAANTGNEENNDQH